jgi:hypothetical protein
MRTRLSVAIFLTTAICAPSLRAQQPQIPTLQVCNLSGNMTVQSNPPAKVTILSRKDATHTGSFTVTVRVTCDANGYPAGTLTITNLSMTDSTIQGTITATTFEQLTSTGKDTPTAYLSGRCTAQAVTGAPQVSGCRYWIMFADNAKPTSTVPPSQMTPDIISFLVFDKAGKRVAYGTGPVVTGNIDVTPTTF